MSSVAERSSQVRNENGLFSNMLITGDPGKRSFVEHCLESLISMGIREDRRRAIWDSWPR